jgi:dockerin type I repeat protein
MKRVLGPAVVAALLLARAAHAQPVGHEFRVNSVTTDQQLHPSAAPISDVEYVVVWQDQDANGLGVFGQRFKSDGTPSGPEFRVNIATTGNQATPSVGSDLAGNFFVAWADGSNVMGRRFNFFGTPLGTEFQVTTTTSGSQYPSVAGDNAGNFVVVWIASEDGSENAIVGRRYLASGAPAAAPFVVNSYTTGKVQAPVVAAGSSGFVVAWAAYSHAEDAKSGVYARRYLSSGAPQGAEFHVNTSTTGYDDIVRIAVNRSDGAFVVTWRGLADGDDSDGIRARRYAASGTPLADEFRVNTITTYSQNVSSVAFDSSKTFVVVWQGQKDASFDTDIYGQRFSASGPPLGTEFRVNTVTTDFQIYPVIAAPQSDVGSRYLVAWGSPDGDLDGVYGQAYCLVGDANTDGVVDILDVFQIINRLFAGGFTGLGCSDVNNDGAVNVSDVFYLINYLFAGGPPPV